ncbi:MAG: SdrD B-like domain-containing protein [Fimbriimonadaceae bacterium]
MKFNIRSRFKQPPRLGLRPLFIGLVGAIVAIAGAQGSHQIRGVVFDDANGNGAWDRSEPVIPNQQVHLQGAPEDIVATNAEGLFTFRDVPSGSYFLTSPTPLAEMTCPANGKGYFVKAPGNATTFFKIGFHKKCIGIPKLGSVIQPTATPGCFTWDLTFKNLTNYPIWEISFNPTGPTQVYPLNNPSSINHVSLGSPLAPGATTTLHLAICNVSFGQALGIPVVVWGREMNQCCETKIKVNLPEMSCFRIYEQKLTCRSASSFGWQFCLQNLSGKNANAVYFGGIRDASGLLIGTVNPSAVTGISLPNLGSYCFNVTLNGVPASSVVFIDLLLYRNSELCCVQKVVLRLPQCGVAICCPGEDHSRKPTYEDPRWAAFRDSVAVITCGNNTLANPSSIDDPALAILDLDHYQTTPPILGDQWNRSSAMYHGPPTASFDLWTQRNLGTIFGETIDSRGNIYVCHFGMYYNDQPGTPNGRVAEKGAIATRFGAVLRIDANTGLIYPFAYLPNNQTTRPGLGNITYDYDHDQLLVSNLEDGLIYRMKAYNPSVGVQPPIATWPVGTYFSPWSGEVPNMVNPNGVAPAPGRRVFGIQYHCGRLYYAKWSENYNQQNSSLSNEIWSVPLGTTGNFTAATPLFVVSEPPSYGSEQNPVSDISFASDGTMGVAEMTIQADGNQFRMWSHFSGGYEYRCVNGIWTPVMNFNLGGGSSYPWSTATNSNGGLDYDYWPFDGARTWFTGAGLNQCATLPPIGSNYCSNLAYGLAGFPKAGGDSWLKAPLGDTIIIDYDNKGGCQAKRFFGDVEIPQLQ